MFVLFYTMFVLFYTKHELELSLILLFSMKCWSQHIPGWVCQYHGWLCNGSWHQQTINRHIVDYIEHTGPYLPPVRLSYTYSVSMSRNEKNANMFLCFLNKLGTITFNFRADYTFGSTSNLQTRYDRQSCYIQRWCIQQRIYAQIHQ